MDSPTVQAKKTAAEQWARHVTDNGDHGTWTYVLISQSVAENAPTFAAALQQAGARAYTPAATTTEVSRGIRTLVRRMSRS